MSIIAEYIALFTPKVDQGASTKVKSELASVASSASASFGKMSEHISGAITSVLAPLALFHGALNFAKGLEHAALLGNELSNMSQIVNVGVQDLQGLTAAAANVNVSTHQVEIGLRRLSFVMNKAKEGTKGFSDILPGKWWEDAQGKTLSSTQMMMKLADIMNAMPNTIEKTAKMHVLLGRTGERLEPLFNKGSTAIQTYVEKLKRYGLAVDDVGVKKSVELNSSLQDLSLAWQGLQQQMSNSAFSTAIRWGFEKITSLVVLLKDGISRTEFTTNKARLAFGLLAAIAVPALLLIGNLVVAVTAKLLAAAAASGIFTLTLGAPLWVIIAGLGILALILDDVWGALHGEESLFSGLAEALDPVIVMLADALYLIEHITDPAAWDVLSQSVLKTFNWLGNALGKIPYLGPLLKMMAQGQGEVMSRAVSGVANLGTDFSSSAQTNIGEGIPQKFNPMNASASLPGLRAPDAGTSVSTVVNMSVQPSAPMDEDKLASYMVKKIDEHNQSTLKKSQSYFADRTLMFKGLVPGQLTWAVTDDLTGSERARSTIVLDVIEDEAVSKSAEVTRFPVERGIKPADHHRPENAKIRLKVKILSFQTSLAGGGVGEQADIAGDPAFIEVRAAAAYNRLDAARENSYFVTYITPDRKFDNCLITQLDYNTDAKTGYKAMSLSIGLEQQTFVDLQRVKTKRIKSKNNVCSPAKDEGKKTGDEAKQVKGRTLLNQARRLFTSFGQ